MSRAIGFIVAAAQIGVGVATGNVALIVSGTIQLAGQTASLLSASSAAKPEQTETAIKTERPPRVKGYGTTRRYGASLLYESARGHTVDVWAFHDGRAAAITRTYLNDNQVTVSGNTVATLPDKSYQSGHVKLGYSLGRPVETAFSPVTALIPAWDASHRGDGVVLGYVIKEPEKEKYFLETYPQGDSVTLSLVGNWTTVYDPRDASQNPYNEATWKWSDNAVLCFLHYLMVERGKDWNRVMAPKLPIILAAINDADTPMALSRGGTEKRYRTALSYKATEEPANVVGSLLAAFDGWYVFDERGELIVYSGRVYTPTVSIGPSEIVSFRHQAGVADEDYVNEIAVPYVSDLHDYSEVDAEPWRDEDDISERGRVATAELGAVVPSFTQGRRLAKRKMARTNASDRGTITTNWSGRTVMGQRYINLDVTEAGATFYRGVAEITSVERDPNTGGYTFDWVAADRNVDAWNPVTEDGEGAPVGNRYAPAPLIVPTVSSAQVITATATGDGTFTGTGARIQINVPSDGSPGLTWYARWRVGDTGVWNEQEYPDEDAGPNVSLLTGFVPLDGTIQIEVEYRNAGGQLSGWSAPFEVDAAGSPADPPTIAAALITTSKPSEALSIQATTDASSTVTISAHDRIYSDRTVPVQGGSITGLTPSTYYALFYDDEARGGGSVAYMASTNTDDAQLSVDHPYRHYVGFAMTPAVGGQPSSGGSASGPGGNGGGYQLPQPNDQ